MHVHLYVGMHVCVCMCRGHVLTLGIFPDHFPSLLRQGLLLNWELSCLIGLSRILLPGGPRPCLRDVGLYGATMPMATPHLLGLSRQCFLH